MRIDPGAGAGAGASQQLLSVLVSMLVLVSVLVSVSSSRVGEDTEPKEPRDALPEMVGKEGASQALYHARVDWEWRQSRTRRVL